MSNAVSKYKEGFNIDETQLKKILGENKYDEYLEYTKNNPGAVKSRKKALKDTKGKPQIKLSFD